MENVSYLRKYVREVLVYRLGGLSLPRKSVVRLTDRPEMSLAVYRECKTTTQQQRSMANQCMPRIHRIISEMLYEFIQWKKCDFLEPIIHSQII